MRDECELKLGQQPYSSKLNEPIVFDMANYNKSFVEPHSDFVDAAFLNYRPDIMPSWDPLLQQKMKILKTSCIRLDLMNRQKQIPQMKLKIV